MSRRSLVGAILALAVAGCSTAQSLRDVPAPLAASRLVRHDTSSYQYATIFSFQGFNGASPESALVYFKGKLYGTTARGGYYGQGVVFSITPSGKESVLHNFGLSGDGVEPEGGLTVLNGTLYGTTNAGGAYNKGTLFSVTPGGRERVLYSFGYTAGDGNNPTGVTPLNGVLYGTATYGGVGSAGTIFKVTTAGAEKTIFYFPDYSKKDGMNPSAGLLAYNGTLYGTTYGSGPCLEGTVFSVTTSGKEKTIYGFPCQRYDGENPQASLVEYNGVLYGTTTYGGKAFYNNGTVFSLTLSGNELVLFDFIPSTQYGGGPKSGLIVLNGALYGTTPSAAANGAGSVYSLTTSGSPTLLHAFGLAPDGSKPLTGLTNVNRTLYGTTSSGGGVANAGTVLRITPVESSGSEGRE
jgi:uncharacterized repeat protein (TIGR03803 family)